MTIPANQLHILHHTLGLRPDRRDPYRNHFVAGPGHHDMPALEALVDEGLMTKTKPPGFIDPGSMVFMATAEGKSLAVELLPPEPKLTKYQQYLRDDSGLTFAEWLGIYEPEYRHRRWGSRNEWRMVRRSRPGRYGNMEPIIAGEWAPTQKAAKASYKEALKASRGKA